MKIEVTKRSKTYTAKYTSLIGITAVGKSFNQKDAIIQLLMQMLRDNQHVDKLESLEIQYYRE